MRIRFTEDPKEMQQFDDILLKIGEGTIDIIPGSSDMFIPPNLIQCIPIPLNG